MGSNEERYQEMKLSMSYLKSIKYTFEALDEIMSNPLKCYQKKNHIEIKVVLKIGIWFAVDVYKWSY